MKKLFFVIISGFVVFTAPLCAVRMPVVDVPEHIEGCMLSLLEMHKLDARLFQGQLVARARELSCKLIRDAENTVSDKDIGMLCCRVVNETLENVRSIGQNAARNLRLLTTVPVDVHSPCAQACSAGDAVLDRSIRVSFSGNVVQCDDLTLGEVYQISSAVQKAAECGCYVKYNALAIAHILGENKVLSPQEIKCRVEHLEVDAGSANWIDETAVFADLCATLPGEHVYMLKVEQINHGQEVRVVPAGATTDKNAFSMDEFWALSKDVNAELAGYFVVNLDNSHWVLVVALKQKGMTGPAFLYLDSQNSPLKKSPLAGHLVTYLKQHALGNA